MSCPRDCIILAGIGGIIPTISKLAGTYATNPSAPLPGSGMFFALLLFFIIGSVLAYAFSETTVRQAFIIGLCAPGIITNIGAGVTGKNSTKQTAKLYAIPFISSAYAQGENTISNSLAISEEDSDTINRYVPRERKVIIQNKLYGAGSWDTKNIPIHVTSITKDGKRETIGKFDEYQPTIELSVSEQASVIEIWASGKATEIPLPKSDYTQATIDSKVRVEGNDFLWALGAQRRLRVVSVNGDISHVEPAKPETSVKYILGQSVIQQ